MTLDGVCFGVEGVVVVLWQSLCRFTWDMLISWKFSLIRPIQFPNTAHGTATATHSPRTTGCLKQ